MPVEKGKIATLFKPDRPDRILALWIQFHKNNLTSNPKRAAVRIKKLTPRVPGCIRDFIVVTGEGIRGREKEIIVIANVNQLQADKAAFNVLSTKVREALGGAFTQVPYPNEALYNPRVVYDDAKYNGWHPVKRRRS